MPVHKLAYWTQLAKQLPCILELGLDTGKLWSSCGTVEFFSTWVSKGQDKRQLWPLLPEGLTCRSMDTAGGTVGWARGCWCFDHVVSPPTYWLWKTKARLFIVLRVSVSQGLEKIIQIVEGHSFSLFLTINLVLPSHIHLTHCFIDPLVFPLSFYSSLCSSISPSTQSFSHPSTNYSLVPSFYRSSSFINPFTTHPSISPSNCLSIQQLFAESGTETQRE